jgi:hypothetical protein
MIDLKSDSLSMPFKMLANSSSSIPQLSKKTLLIDLGSNGQAAAIALQWPILSV